MKIRCSMSSTGSALRKSEVELAPDLVVPHATASDAAHAEEFFETALRHGHEGMMAKSLVAPCWPPEAVDKAG